MQEPITTKLTGTGLGLTIVERIIVDHCGEMRLSNKNSGGAKIELTFDIKKLREKLK